MEGGPVETRVLGCLIEKQRTTPDAYPLTLNALRLACNQATNRDPVVDYDDATIRAALERLGRARLVRLASGQGTRAPKYRHLLAETLGLARDELAVLAVLMLRGAQTPGELRQRTARLHAFDEGSPVETTLERLAEGGRVRRLERRPGQKEERYLQLLVSDRGDEAGAIAHADTIPPDLGPAEVETGESGELAHAQAAGTAAGGEPSDTDQRLVRLEEELASVREALRRLERELGLETT